MSKRYSGILRDIALCAGNEAADALEAHFGGGRLYIPGLRALKPDSAIVRVVGLEAAKLIVAEVGFQTSGVDFEIPIGASSPVAKAQAQMKACIKAALSEGRGTSEIAKMCGCSRRTVQGHKQRMAEIDLPPTRGEIRDQRRHRDHNREVRARIIEELQKRRSFSRASIERIAVNHNRSVDFVRRIYTNLRDAGKLPLAEEVSS